MALINEDTEISVLFLTGFDTPKDFWEEHTAKYAPAEALTAKRDSRGVRRIVLQRYQSQSRLLPGAEWGAVKRFFYSETYQNNYDLARRAIYTDSICLSEHCNTHVCHNGGVVLLAHSTETELAVEVARRLRPDILVSLVLYGGTVKEHNLLSLVGKRGVGSCLNFINKRDRKLKKHCDDNPIGLSLVLHGGILDIEVEARGDVREVYRTNLLPGNFVGSSIANMLKGIKVGLETNKEYRNRMIRLVNYSMDTLNKCLTHGVEAYHRPSLLSGLQKLLDITKLKEPVIQAQIDSELRQEKPRLYEMLPYI